MGEKKRKREHGNTEKPRKKVEVEPPSMVVKVNYVTGQEGIGPLLAVTAGCNPPEDTTFQAFRKRLGKGSEYEYLLHSSSHPALDYTAREEKSGSADSLLKHYIGIYDPQAAEVTFVQVPRLVLRSRVRPTQKEIDEEKQSQSERSNLRDARQALGMEFGTKRQKKALLNMSQNAISPAKKNSDGTDVSPVKDKLTAAMLETMNATLAGMPSQEERQAATDDAKPRPEANTAAEKPQDVYPLDSLIPEELFSSLEVKIWVDTAARNAAIKTHSRFVSARVHALAIGQDIRKLKVLKYMLAMINFKAACIPTREGGLKLPKDKEELNQKVGASMVVLHDIKHKFSMNGQLTKWHTDLFHTHLCALALHVDGFTTDTHDLREDLRLDTAQVGRYFRELGCRVGPPSDRDRERWKIAKQEAAMHKVAKLRIPLEFPKERKIARAAAGRRT